MAPVNPAADGEFVSLEIEVDSTAVLDVGVGTGVEAFKKSASSTSTTSSDPDPKENDDPKDDEEQKDDKDNKSKDDKDKDKDDKDEDDKDDKDKKDRQRQLMEKDHKKDENTAKSKKAESETTKTTTTRNTAEGPDKVWIEISSESIDRLSRTVLFKINDFGKYFDITNDDKIKYRVKYDWNGQTYYWDGKIRRKSSKVVSYMEESDEPSFSIATFSCDHGYVFPLPQMVKNVKKQDPDVVFFAGDQIYEQYGGYGFIRGPLEVAMLDYLRKWYLFGWTWRDVLKDRVSVILADDHDVYHGNLWGEKGVPLDWDKPYTNGGYKMNPIWVNAVQKTQMGHLPDPYDPTPIEQDIEVYYTDFVYGGVPIAIVEDRKFKSAPSSVLPNGWKNVEDAKLELNPYGGQLLGGRQEVFLQNWSQETESTDLRLVLSASIFAHTATHVGYKLVPDKNNADSTGWPKRGRDRALRPLMNNADNTVMLHGDQHMGILVKHGIDEHEDGPFAFMVPGTANGYPRAWWPEGQDAPEETWTGQFEDDFGNFFTVYAAANPDVGSNRLNTFGPNVVETAHKKGSGYGVMTFYPERSDINFDMWRFDFDAKNINPDGSDQFSGFPQSFKLSPGGETRRRHRLADVDATVATDSLSSASAALDIINDHLKHLDGVGVDVGAREESSTTSTTTSTQETDDRQKQRRQKQRQARLLEREVRMNSWIDGEVLQGGREDDKEKLRQVVDTMKREEMM